MSENTTTLPTPARSTRALGAAVAAVALAVGMAACAPEADTPSTTTPPVVEITQGMISGVSADGSESFLGLPYAAPPVEENRFAAPAEAAGWDGTREATAHGNSCLQGGDGEVAGTKTSEDCLYLDVYRPASTTSTDALPVVMWIHGGGFGSGGAALFDPSEFADRTGTVVAVINYRVGAMGYLATETMGADAGSFGLLDQVAALRWVHENIPDFGGDADRVTVAGQSAGAMSICGLLAAPSTTGLISGAILQSGSCAFNAYTARENAVEKGDQLATEIGCPAGDEQLECLQSVDTTELVNAPARFTPVFGSSVLPTRPQDAIAEGDWDAIPLLVGSNRWEGKQGIFFSVGPDAGSMTAEEYDERIRQSYGDDAEEILQRYQAADYDSPAMALAAIDTDSTFGCTTYAFASSASTQVPVYAYEFEDPTSPTMAGMAIEGLDMSSAHSSELAYLFDFADVERPLTDAEKELSHRMMDYWGAFAATGELGEPWQRFEESDPRFLKLSSEGDETFTDFADVHQCEFWASSPTR
ncbi:carboxylesterase/lipase family protein [Microbacterium sp. 22215]|uniref:carboxylesterase/lipase family protein n=1 Tax=Microbacterium sp. 22215 TaxID=3453893 RepID=UPI003F82B2FD